MGVCVFACVSESVSVFIPQHCLRADSSVLISAQLRGSVRITDKINIRFIKNMLSNAFDLLNDPVQKCLINKYPFGFENDFFMICNSSS